MLRVSMSFFLLFTLTSASLATEVPKCEEVVVSLRAVEARIPWFPKEHYVDMMEAEATSIECRLHGHEDSSASSSTRPKVTWLYYEQYVNLDSLSKDNEELKKACMMLETREEMDDLEVHSPEPQELDKDEREIEPCPLSMKTTVEYTSNSDHLSSTLTLLQPKASLSGTYRCLFTWGVDNATCLDKEEMEMRLDELSRRRSGTLYMKIYEKQEYKSDLTHVGLAIVFLTIVLVIVALLDHVANAKKPVFYSPAV